MKTVLHLLRSYFVIVPLQRWINACALLLLAVTAVAQLFDRDNGTLRFTMLGVSLLTLVPAMLGGVALRFGSTRTVLHLKPQGRVCMIVAASLTITLLALLITLPFGIDQWVGVQRPGGRHIDPAHVFPIAWTGLMLLWIGIFSISHSMFAFGLVGLFPIAAIATGRFIAPYLPHPAWLLLPAVAVWLAFAAWYLRTDFVTRPQLTSAGNSPEQGFAPLLWLWERMAPRREMSRNEARHMHLFGAPRSVFVLTGVWVALIFLLVHQFVMWTNSNPARLQSGSSNLLFMLPFMGPFLFSLGFATLRRARYLWLRERLDRSALFALTERLGLQSGLTCWGVTAAVVLAVTLGRSPDHARFVLPYVIAHASFAMCLFYCGMSMTRGWAVRDVLLAMFVWLWFVVQLFLLRPTPDAAPGMAWKLTLAALLFAALLRWHAARKWRALDWRIAMPSRLVARANA